MAHPEHGIVSPARFIPVAEDIGAMDQISVRMLDQAVNLLAKWGKMGPPYRSLFVTVNLEAHQVMQPDFSDHLAESLARHDITANKLKIEIVESSVIGNFATAACQLAAIRSSGVQIALDDFGTGYSSLEYLNELSFDLIKVDKTFVDDMETDPRKRSMVKMMCVLAETLGAEVCIEGLENADQAGVAKELKADFGQGYLYSKPLPQADLEDLLQKAAKSKLPRL